MLMLSFSKAEELRCEIFTQDLSVQTYDVEKHFRIRLQSRKLILFCSQVSCLIAKSILLELLVNYGATKKEKLTVKEKKKKTESYCTSAVPLKSARSF